MNQRKYIFWILGIIAWLFVLGMFWSIDIATKNKIHQIIITVAGICLAVYIYRKTGSKEKELEQQIQELKAENQRLREQADQQLVQQIT